uniref:Mismatch repair protein n=1 Tax=Trypanosoma congolense (strain IL3000) TaxID=1068625 RepID=G0UUZ0_TRYCI|nr:mismatch repair protein [Trypanosoma congolense IL3000]
MCAQKEAEGMGGEGIMRRLDGESARKLSAGQVITNLSSVIKELVENSLDAGACNLAIFIEDYGVGCITVDDDGRGMGLSHLLDDVGCVKEGVCVPLLASRATTKVKETDDVYGSQSLDTLGFRGEALHCLAQLSEVTVSTMSESTQPTSLCITYDSKSHLANAVATSERRGVGTTVTVRKLFAGLPVRHADFLRNRKKQLLAATTLVKQYALSHPHVRLLMTHRVTPESAPVTLVSLTGTNDPQRALAEAYGGRVLAGMVRVEWEVCFGTIIGYVSKVGGGRVTTDMQVFALDGRLVDLPAIAKAISDAYGECLPNAAQRVFPAFFLHVHTGDDVPYDVNLVPSKRKVLMAEEMRHAEEVHSCALRSFQVSSEGVDLDMHGRVGLGRSTERKTPQEAKLVRTPISATSITQFTYQPSDVQPLSVSQEEAPASTMEMSTLCSSLYFDHLGSSDSLEGSKLFSESASTSSTEHVTSESSQCSSSDGLESTSDSDSHRHSDRKRGRSEVSPEEEPMGGDQPAKTFITDEGNMQRPVGPRTRMKFPSLSELAQRPLVRPISKYFTATGEYGDGGTPSFSKLLEQSEKELKLHLDKCSFKDMVVHGQFNHGFIVTSLGDNIFVIDQHAADEKFNYENLMSRYVAKPQPLISPVAVPMEPQTVDLAIDNSDELQRHGFIVRRGEDDNRLLVHSVPVLPYEVVKPHDVMELLNQLTLYGVINRPMRCVWHSMATKACRSSIMIGTVLSEKTMRSVVSRLSELEQPWNCPHGRPTLRHIARISSLASTMMRASSD